MLPGDLTATVITGTFEDVTGAPLWGKVTFTPSTTLSDTTGSVVIRPVGRVYWLSSGTFESDPLLSTDNPDIQPAGWTYTALVEIADAQAYSFSFLLPASPSTVDMSALQPVVAQPSVISFIPSTGGNVSGTLVLGGSPPLQMAAGASAGAVLTSDGSGNVSWSPGPLSAKDSVQAATAAALPANSYASGALTAASNGALTVDGIAVTAGMRILVQNEVAGASNGIYTVTTAGGASVKYVLTRASDMAAGSEVPGAFTYAEQGTANAGAGFIVQGAGPFTLGTTAIPWVQFTGSGTVSAGTGLSKSGSTLSLAIPVAASSGGTGQTTLQAALNAMATAVTSGLYLRGNGTNVVLGAIQAADVPTLNQNTTGNAATASLAGNVTGTVAIANGGTAATTAAAALTSLGALPLAGGTMTGAITLPGNPASSLQAAPKQYVDTETTRATTAEALLAPLASPALTGSPTAPTQTTGDSTTKIATDAFVATAVATETSRATTAEGLKLAKASNLSDVASAGTALGNLGGAAVAGDIGGTSASPTVAKIQGTAISTPAGGSTAYLNASGAWTTPAGGGGGIAPPAGDIGGSSGTPTVVATHLSSALPVAQGGTGQATAAAALTALTGTQSAGKVVRSDGTNATLAVIQVGDVPTLNQNTTGTAAGLSSTLAIASGGTGSSTRNFAGLITPTAVKTGAYSAAAGDFVVCDTTLAAFTVTLPTGPAVLSRVGVKMVTLGGSNSVTIAAGGTDVFNKTGGSTSLTLSRALQTVLLQYATGIWYVTATDPAGVSTLAATDASIVVGGTATAPTVATGTLDVIAAQHPPAGNVAMNSHKITGLANGSAGSDAAAFGQTPAGGAVVSGQFLCTPTSYAPGTQTSLTVNTTTMAAFSSANVNTGPFTAPPSGTVMVTVSFVAQASAAAGFALGLAAHGTVTPIVSNEVIGKFPTSATATLPIMAGFMVAGLTSGTSYNLDLVGCMTTSDTMTILAVGVTGTTPTVSAGGQGAAVLISVQAI